MTGAQKSMLTDAQNAEVARRMQVNPENPVSLETAEAFFDTFSDHLTEEPKKVFWETRAMDDLAVLIETGNQLGQSHGDFVVAVLTVMRHIANYPYSSNFGANRDTLEVLVPNSAIALTYTVAHDVVINGAFLTKEKYELTAQEREAIEAGTADTEAGRFAPEGSIEKLLDRLRSA